MKKITKSLIVITIFAYLYSLFSIHYSPTAYASEQTLRVSPAIIPVTLSPGKTYAHDVTIENLSDAPVPLRATLSDFMTGGEDGGYVFAETRNNPLLSWVSLDTSEFILNPKEKKTMHMVIHTPKEIPVGGYYGVLFFEPVVQGEQANGTLVSAKVGVLMLANIGVPDPNAKKADILTFSTDFFQTHDTVPFLLRVKNTSLNFFSAKPILQIKPLLNYPQDAKSYTLEEKTIFPGNIRRWTEDNTVQNLSPNLYQAHIIVATGNGQDVTSDLYFAVLPFGHALLVIVVAIIALFLLTKRKRLAKAFQALIRP